MHFHALLLNLLFTWQTAAFFPSTWLSVIGGLGAVSHQKMTEDAFVDRAASYFDITRLTRKMKDARDEIVAANEAVDKNQKNAHWHCDGESFPLAQVRIKELKDEVIANMTAENPNASAARVSLGGALHTIQDFYSHSNWIELGNRSPNSDLIKSNSMAGYTSRFSERTCNGCESEFFPFCDDCSGNTDGFRKLSSGYYFGEDSPPAGVEIPDYKCHHGGYFDTKKTFDTILDLLTGDPAEGINKDSFSCEFSPHWRLHSDAVETAKAASIEFFDEIKAELDDKRLLKLLFGIGPTIAFAIDTTGSMAAVISAVRETVISFVEDQIGTDREPGSFVVVPFGDPSVGPLSSTVDFDIFKSIVNSLGASGGGDCPELSTSGTILAADALERGSTLMVFTDADAKDKDREFELLDILARKQIVLYFFKLDSFCDSFPRKLKSRSDPVADLYYSRLVASTGGRYFSGPVSSLDDFRGILDTTFDPDKSTILRVEDTVSATLAYSIPVDSYMSKLTLSLRADSATMKITEPDGTPIAANGTDGVIILDLSDTMFISIQNPMAGTYTVNVEGTGSFTLLSTGVSPIHSTFWFASVEGRPGHDGWYALEGPPPLNTRIGAMADVSGAFSTASFILRSPSNAVIKPIDLMAGPGGDGHPAPNQFLGRVDIPSTSFYVYISGNDNRGAPYQRLIESLFVPAESNATYYLGIDKIPAGLGLIPGDSTGTETAFSSTETETALYSTGTETAFSSTETETAFHSTETQTVFYSTETQTAFYSTETESALYSTETETAIYATVTANSTRPITSAPTSYSSLLTRPDKTKSATMTNTETAIYSISTIYASTTYTITSCREKTICHPEVTTEVISITTTVCEVTMSTSKVYSTYTTHVKYCDQNGGACHTEVVLLSTPCSYALISVPVETKAVHGINGKPDYKSAVTRTAIPAVHPTAPIVLDGKPDYKLTVTGATTPAVHPTAPIVLDGKPDYKTTVIGTTTPVVHPTAPIVLANRAAGAYRFGYCLVPLILYLWLLE